MDSFDRLVADLVAEIDLEVVFAVQAATALVKSALNVWTRTREAYTDWATPFVAVMIGIAFSFLRKGVSWDAALHGLVLGGGAIFFQTMWAKGVTGWSVLTGRHKDDPVIQAKVERQCTDADKRIANMKQLLQRKPKEPEKAE